MTPALREALAAALDAALRDYDDSFEVSPTLQVCRDSWAIYGELADALLPIVDAALRYAQAKAWAEGRQVGARWAESVYARTERARQGRLDYDISPWGPNPYREPLRSEP